MGTNLIKESNLKTLRGILRQEKVATKSRLSQVSGLSVVTVQSLIKTLLETGEVVEDHLVQPQFGRPAASYRYNENIRLALIINMFEQQGQDTAGYRVYNLYGECLESLETYVPSVSLRSYETCIEDLIERYPNICVIGFGLPCNEINGRLVTSDYELLLNEELAPYYEKRCRIPVFIENDINAAVLGYCERCGYRNDEEFYAAGIYLPSKYPPGAGFCHNFEILKGVHGLAGELKHLPLSVDWEHFSYEKQALEEIAVTLVQMIMCFYNPERIVIYHEGMNPELPDHIRTVCNSKLEHLMLPMIDLKDSLKKDFDAGLIRMALEKII